MSIDTEASASKHGITADRAEYMEARGWVTLTAIEEHDIAATSLDELLDILISDNPEQDFSFTHSDGVVRVWTSLPEHDRGPVYVEFRGVGLSSNE